VEAPFKDLRGDLAIRPIFHQNQQRSEAHIFVAFMAYCLHITLKPLLRQSAPGLTPRMGLAKLSAMQLLDVHFPTTDGRELVFTRHTEPEPDKQLLLYSTRLQAPQGRHDLVPMQQTGSPCNTELEDSSIEGIRILHIRINLPNCPVAKARL
jgi:hypothetical protein